MSKSSNSTTSKDGEGGHRPKPPRYTVKRTPREILAASGRWHIQPSTNGLGANIRRSRAQYITPHYSEQTDAG